MRFTAYSNVRFSKAITLNALIALLFCAVSTPLTPVDVAAQSGSKPSSVVIRDSTTEANGGESATKSLRDKLKAALERESPCTETMDDQDIRDAIQDERERALLEGNDSTEALKMIGERLGSAMVMNVQALPGPGGTTVFSAFVMDTRSAKTVARAIGSENEVADKLVRDLASYLADTCKPHWAGTVRYVFSYNETKTATDEGAAHAVRKNVKRTVTQTSNMLHTIKASLQGTPGAGESVGSPKAQVMQRRQFTFRKSSNSVGETRCREPGKNPYFTNFSEEYSETTTMLGQGTDMMPVFISIDDDGRYSIHVTAPAGVLIGKIETTRSYSGCPSEKPPTPEPPRSLPEGRIEATSFEAGGKVDRKNKDVLSGTQTLPDGKTTISWNLRLVKPKGK